MLEVLAEFIEDLFSFTDQNVRDDEKSWIV